MARALATAALSATTDAAAALAAGHDGTHHLRAELPRGHHLVFALVPLHHLCTLGTGSRLETVQTGSFPFSPEAQGAGEDSMRSLRRFQSLPRAELMEHYH